MTIKWIILCNNKCFINKEHKIPLEYYENIFNKITEIYYKYSNKTNYTVIAVNGTYNNTIKIIINLKHH
jgi:hypothetical protein